MSAQLRPYKAFFPQIGLRVMIDASSVVIGDVRIADDVSVWPLVAIRGDVNYVSIGQRSNIQDGSVLHVTHKSSYKPEGNPLIIGEDVTVGHKVMLHGCTIGNRVLVGMGSILLDGVVVGDDVMIGAGSLVPQNKQLESGYLYFGNPVKQIRPLTEAEREGLKYSANNYVKWKKMSTWIRITRSSPEHLPDHRGSMLLPLPLDPNDVPGRRPATALAPLHRKRCCRICPEIAQVNCIPFTSAGEKPRPAVRHPMIPGQETESPDSCIQFLLQRFNDRSDSRQNAVP